MAQNGFAFFFLLLIVGSAIAMLLTVAESWPEVMTALIGAPPAPVVRRYRSFCRRPIDVPEVARRLLPRGEGESVMPALAVHSSFYRRRSERGPRQLRFRFA